MPSSKPSLPRTAAPAKARAKPSGPAKNSLSPRGRGSVAKPADEDRLLVLFSENVRRVRTYRGLSQEALADLADLDRTYVSSIERKKRNISVRNIQRLAEALKVDARVLLDPDLRLDPTVPG